MFCIYSGKATGPHTEVRGPVCDRCDRYQIFAYLRVTAGFANTPRKYS